MQDQWKNEESLVYRLLVESTGAGFVILDPAGRVLDANAEYVRMTGRGSREAVIGKCVTEWTSERDRERNAEEVRKCLERGFVRNVEIHYQDATGRETSVEVNATVVAADGERRILTLCRDISARRRAEEELRASEERFKTLFEKSAEAQILLDDDSNVVDGNAAFLRLFGLADLGEVRGHPPNDYAPEFQPDGTSSQQRGSEMLKTVLAQGSARSEWAHFKHDADRTPLLTEVIITLIRVAGRPMFHAAIRDITDRKRAEEALAESEKKYRAIFERAAEGILIADFETRRFRYANPAICRMLGYTLDELRALRVHDIHPSADLPRVLAEFDAESHGDKSLAMSVPCRRKNGTVFFADISASAVVLDGTACNLGFFVDITERTRAEEERLRLEAQMLQAQKLESLGLLAGGIAHDFNNLLMAILGNVELAMQDGAGGAVARPLLEDVSTAARHAADLCRQLLAYSGRGRFVVTNVDLSALLTEMRQMLEMPVARKESFRYRLAERLPAIEADVSQIRQVVMNLVINASEAMGEKAGTITVTTGARYCDASYLEKTRFAHDLRPGHYVYLEVADTGCGMDAATVDRIFDPFFTTKFTGRGLGLAAVLGIVRGHKGALDVHSEPRRGTTFTLLFPAAAASAEPAAAPSDAARSWQGSGVVLLVDDEPAVRDVARRMLERLGFVVLTADDGDRALDVFRGNVERIRCVILDLTMPRLGGEETLRELRRIDPGVRVLLSSGHNEQDVIGRFTGEEISGFIQKPYQLDSLGTILRDALDGS